MQLKPPGSTHQQILAVVHQFASAYGAQDLTRIDHFVNETFAPDGDLLIIGMSQEWPIGREGAKQMITDHWQNLGKVELDLESLQLSQCGSVAWVALRGKIAKSVAVDQLHADAVEHLRAVCSDDTQGAELRMAEILRAANDALYQSERGTDFLWPFRITGVLVERDGLWLFRHLQFSHGANTTPDDRIPAPDLNTRPWFDFTRTNETEQVRQVLQSFQDGYSSRNLDQLGSFMTLFAPDEDVLIVGTGDNEWQHGLEQATSLVRGDWKYWGQLSLDCDRAMITTEGDVAWLATHGVVSNHFERERVAKNVLSWLNVILTNDLPPKAMLLELARECAYGFNCAARGEDFYFAIRFTAVLVRREGHWLFHQMQFSYATLQWPDERLGGLWASPQ